MVYPASKAGLYAMRPTLGIVSSRGVFRISKTYDGIGAMARTPLDLSLLVESILTPSMSRTFGKFLTKIWAGLRIGVVDPTYGVSSDETRAKWTSEPIVCSIPFLCEFAHADSRSETKLRKCCPQDPGAWRICSVPRDCAGTLDPEVRWTYNKRYCV